MTQDQKTELEYLIDLLREASKWNVDQGDDALRCEVDLRISTILNGEEPTDAEPDNLPAEDEALTGAEHLASPGKVDEARKKWEKEKVRVYIDGKHVWKPRAQCLKQPRDNSKGGAPWKWVWIDPNSPTVDKNLPTKSEQVEAMWAEHEQEGK